jgi:DNA-binding HxlR family transcriptional regulator
MKKKINELHYKIEGKTQQYILDKLKKLLKDTIILKESGNAFDKN